jgi:hypothetical protein
MPRFLKSRFVRFSGLLVALLWLAGPALAAQKPGKRPHKSKKS